MNDPIRRINMLRAFHTGREAGSSSEVTRELKQIKGELRILNDENARKTTPITNATNSPYLPDQSFQTPGVVFNSTEETEWKEVKTAEQQLAQARRKLNIL